MREIGEALVAVGYDNLDDQAAAPGTARSITRTIIKNCCFGTFVQGFCASFVFVYFL
jgi:hypothetical protein